MHNIFALITQKTNKIKIYNNELIKKEQFL